MKVEKIWLTDTAVWIRTDEGKEACELLADYPRLKHATLEQLRQYEADDYGIHWPEIDEDLCFDGFYSPVTLEANDKSVLYLGADNTLYWPSAAMTVGSCRAVFSLNGLTTGSAGDLARIVLNFGDEATGITTTALTDDTDKAGAWHDMQGRRLTGKPSRAGVYINNGKKVVIK